MTRTNRHLLCAYFFTPYAHYMYVAVPIQQGTQIRDLFNILLLGYYCVTHSDYLAIPTDIEEEEEEAGTSIYKGT
jgi:hypothetical protein